MIPLDLTAGGKVLVAEPKDVWFRQQPGEVWYTEPPKSGEVWIDPIPTFNFNAGVWVKAVGDWSTREWSGITYESDLVIEPPRFAARKLLLYSSSVRAIVTYLKYKAAVL